MKTSSLLLATAMLAVFASASHADTFKGTVIAFDRKANVIVIDDKSVFNFDGQDITVPDNLKAGDMIEIESEGEGEDGYGVLTSVKILN